MISNPLPDQNPPAVAHRISESRQRRRGVSVLLAMWSVVIAALTATSIQLVSFRQAHLGHEVLQRTQARWAARGWSRIRRGGPLLGCHHA